MPSQFQALVERIESRSDVIHREHAIERMREAIARLGLRLPRPEQVILVVGTNGKGSTAKTLETLLMARGESAGLFTSPHLLSITERIRSYGTDLSEEEFTAAFARVEPEFERQELGRFETLTLMMLEIFFGGRIRPPIERAVIEAGVGGRLDPTRVIPHATTVIARLGLDHEALLGNTLPAIAREKFGAIDPEGFVVHMPFAADEAERAAIAAVAEEFKIRLGGRWVEAPTYPSRVDASEGEPRWILQTPWGEAQLALLGERAVENTSLALAVLRELGLLRAEMLGALARVNWPGRMERFDVQGRRVYLSGDHNPQGISSLAEIIAHFRYDRLHIVAGIGAHKDAREILARLAALPRAHVHLTPTPFRSSRLEDLRAYAPLANSIDESPRKAIERALAEGKPDDLIVVTGSLYLVGAVRSQLVNHHWT